MGGVAAAGAIAVVVLLLVAEASTSADTLVLVPIGLLAGLAAVFGLLDPRVAVILLLITTFFRLILSGNLPLDPFLLAFVGLLAAFLLWLATPPHRLPHLGWLEGTMLLYIFWNVYSMFDRHELSAGYPLTGEHISVYRFILTGCVIPFVMYYIGRSIYTTARSVCAVLWATLGFGIFSAAVSIGQFHAPRFVWPRYIIDAPAWPERANGIFNQPVVNGLVLTIGFVTALVLIAWSPGLPRTVRYLLVVAAAAMAYAVYLTHTRVAWLIFLVIVAIGALLGRRLRSGFLLTLVAMAVGAAVKWRTLIGTNRHEGGMASLNEVDDRLNGVATSWWAFQHEPMFGWGIGRFAAVNTIHHQQWSSDVPWRRGFGIASHFNELGILVELGVVGLLLWLTVLVLIAVKLIRAYRSLPRDGMTGQNLALLAIMAFLALFLVGLTVELRFFDFSTALVYLLAGIAIGTAERHSQRIAPSDFATVAADAGQPVARRGRRDHV